MIDNIWINPSSLIKLIDAFNEFPLSDMNGTINYDTAKLNRILQEKEILEVCNITKETLNSFWDVDLEMGVIVKDLVKNTHLDKSFQDYLAIEKKIENEYSGNFYIYAKQASLSVKSLYYYKKGMFEQAIAITLECIALNDYLILQGLYTLNLRCFEQNKNISRIYYRWNKILKGDELLSNLFNYLFNKINNRLFGSVFNDEKSWEKTPILRESYAYETFVMILEDNIKLYLKQQNVLMNVGWCENLDIDVTTIDRQFIYNWIYINNTLRKNKGDEYIDCIIYFLSQPMSQYYDLLKISLIIDLMKLILNGNYNDKEYLVAQLLGYINNKISTFEELRSNINMVYDNFKVLKTA